MDSVKDDPVVGTLEDDQGLDMFADIQALNTVQYEQVDHVENEHVIDYFWEDGNPVVYIVQDVDSAKQCIMIFFVTGNKK